MCRPPGTTGRRIPDLLTAEVAAAITQAYRQCWGRVIATAYRLTGNLDLAEESAADSFAEAARDWPRSGVPRSVEAWLVTAAKRRAIDQLRRQAVRREIARRVDVERAVADRDAIDPEIEELRFLACCAGAAIDQETQVALLLRYGLGVDTEALTALFNVKRATMAARLTRGKKALERSRQSRSGVEIAEALPAVHRAVYLIFTLGQVPPTGRQPVDSLRLQHADFLSRVVLRHWPSPDARALRMIILLGQDRVAEAVRIAPGDWEVTPLAVQAAIMLAHRAPAGPDWLRIAELYDVLLDLEPNATFALGRAVALGHAFSPDVGLADLDDLAARTDLGRHRYLHAARADCLERLGRPEEAAAAWERAAEVSGNASEAEYFRTRAAGG